MSEDIGETHKSVQNLKQYRRVATRYDKYAVRYLGFVYFSAILITAKKM